MKNEWTRRSIKSRTELSFTQINSGRCAIETQEDKEQEISRGHNTYTLVTVCPATWVSCAEVEQFEL